MQKPAHLMGPVGQWPIAKMVQPDSYRFGVVTGLSEGIRFAQKSRPGRRYVSPIFP